MEVGRHGANGPESAKLRYREAMADLVRETRARLHEARQAQAPERPAEPSRGPDRLDLSAASRALAERRSEAGGPERVGDDDAGMPPELERLRRAYRKGELNVTERVERAAERLLGGTRFEHLLDD